MISENIFDLRRVKRTWRSWGGGVWGWYGGRGSFKAHITTSSTKWVDFIWRDFRTRLWLLILSAFLNIHYNFWKMCQSTSFVLTTMFLFSHDWNLNFKYSYWCYASVPRILLIFTFLAKNSLRSFPSKNLMLSEQRYSTWRRFKLVKVRFNTRLYGKVTNGKYTFPSLIE